MNGSIFRKLLLGLRNNAHRAQLITPNGANRPVLGTSMPEEEQRRAAIVNQWGTHHEAPRQQALMGIKQPLAQRTQTILYYRLTESARQQINGCPQILCESRKQKNDATDINLSTAADGDEN